MSHPDRPHDIMCIRERKALINRLPAASISSLASNIIRFLFEESFCKAVGVLVSCLCLSHLLVSGVIDCTN